MKQVSGNLVDIHSNSIYPATIMIEKNLIVGIRRDDCRYANYILPGFVDSHVHVESSMLTPFEFSKVAIRHGTVAVVSDPHEIANVLGIDGVRFMIENGQGAAIKFHWAIPSCVPATSFETSGSSLGVADMQLLVEYPEVVALAEMMNYVGVIDGDASVFAKLRFANAYHLPVDGHAPGLVGDALLKYISAGITTDHECSTLEEAIEKIQKGMKILIRNGSSAKNFNALAPLVDLYPDKVMFCCDDIHPDDLLRGYIDLFLKNGVLRGLNLFNLLRAACLNPIDHYKLCVGKLRVGDRADFCCVDNLKEFDVTETWIDGESVYSTVIPQKNISVSVVPLNKFKARQITLGDLKVPNLNRPFRAIGVINGELITRTVIVDKIQKVDFLESDIQNDFLKIVVLNRYKDSLPSIGFVHGFGLKYGAIANTVAHDSHNIIAVGVRDKDILKAIKLLLTNKGGVCVVNDSESLVLPLPIAGLLSSDSAEKVGLLYEQLDRKAKAMGSVLTAPFMTMSFMSLLVIPELKIGDKGLFDGRKFEFTSLFL